MFSITPRPEANTDHGENESEETQRTGCLEVTASDREQRYDNKPESNAGDPEMCTLRQITLLFSRQSGPDPVSGLA